MIRETINGVSFLKHIPIFVYQVYNEILRKH